MNRIRIIAQAVGLSLLLGIIGGCSVGGPQLGQVKGVITYDGKPLEGAVVTFVSLDENGTVASGRTNANGEYEMAFTFRQKGAMVGPNRVLIDYSPYDESLGPHNQPKNTFPQKYNRPGTLTAEVQSGSQTIDFQLTSE